MEEKSNDKCNKIYYIKIHSVSAPYISIYLKEIFFKFCISKAKIYSVCSEVQQSGDVKYVRAPARVFVRTCAYLMELFHFQNLVNMSADKFS